MISVASTLLLVSLVFGSVPSAWAAPVGTRNMDVKAMRRMATEPAPIMRRVHHSATSYVPRDDDPIPVVARTDDPIPVVARTDNPIPVVARAGAPEPVTPEPTPKRVSRRHHAKNEARGGSTDAPSRPMPRFKRDEVPKRARSSVPAGEQPEVVARKEDASNSDIARDSEPAKRTLRYRVGTVILPADGSLPNPPPAKREEGLEERHQVGDHHGTPEKRHQSGSHHGTPEKRHQSGSHHGTPEKRHQSGSHHGTPEKREEVTDTVAKRGPIKTIALFRRALAYENLD